MKRVLVVDDDEAITEGLVKLFRMEEIDAAGAFDREGAEALLQGEHYPVILADLRLVTEADGLRLLENIRTISPNSRVASLTGFATPELEARLLELGSTVILRKPMEFEEIIAVISEMFEEIEREAAVQIEQTGKPLDLLALYTKVRPVLFSIPQRRYGLTADETEELVQEAWCLFLQKRDLIQLPGPWLAGTIVNLCKQQIHRSTRMRPVGLEVRDGESAVSRHQAEAADTVLMVREALDRLDERSRKLCVLIGMEGWSYEEVGKSLNLPIGSVGPLYIRSKARLRKAMGH